MKKMNALISKYTRRVQNIDFSPDGTLVASSAYTNVIVRNLATRERVALLTGHNNIVTSVAFSPDGTTLASASYDDTVRL